MSARLISIRSVKVECQGRQIIAREMEMLDYEEHLHNARLRELQHRELNARLGEVRA